MNDHNWHHKEESSSQETAETSPKKIYRAVNWWMIAVLILGLIAISFRIAHLRDVLDDKIANPLLLKAVMQTRNDVSVAIKTPDNVFAGGMPTGIGARALSAIALSNGQTATAERWLIYGMTDLPSSYLTQFELCVLYWENGQRARAREACRGTKASSQYWLNQGYSFENRKQLDEALAYYEIATAVDPDRVQGWYVVGRALFNLKRYEEATVAYERILVLNPTPPVDVYESLAWSYIELDNIELARDVLDRGLLIFPDQRSFYLAMADTYRAESDLDAADGWYARMLQRWPIDVQAWSGRGDMALARGELNAAIRYYQTAVENQPEGYGYWLNLATTASLTDNIPLATEAYQQALAMQPDNPSVLLQAGRFFVETQQIDEATEIFEQVLLLQPGNDEAITQLASLSQAGER